ncbi:MAG: DUF3089 domain-containing protein [Victivallaceae bacterium]|nr:DUF3089 domain-containing protein [Victivallaceae bacterium]
MKKILLLSAVLLLAAGCATAPDKIDYADKSNWVIRDGGTPNASFDLFYIYPTLVADPDKALMDWPEGSAVRAKTEGFAAAQTGIFAPDARVFAPFVRQLEFIRCIPLLENPDVPRRDTELVTGINDTKQAFLYYLENYNKDGRPFVLFGHSQGAMDLYEMLVSTPEITSSRGFVAAYLVGLPHLTAEKLQSDFVGRDIAAATGADDTGAIIIWNTQNAEAGPSAFATPGGACINPLNWKTDGTPADASENVGSLFYDYRDGSSRTAEHFCGARVDPAKGALIVDLPSNSQWDGNGKMGPGIFHINDVWFFAENMHRNAVNRVGIWKKQHDK